MQRRKAVTNYAKAVLHGSNSLRLAGCTYGSRFWAAGGGRVCVSVCVCSTAYSAWRQRCRITCRRRWTRRVGTLPAHMRRVSIRGPAATVWTAAARDLGKKGGEGRDVKKLLPCRYGTVQYTPRGPRCLLLGRRGCLSRMGTPHPDRRPGVHTI